MAAVDGSDYMGVSMDLTFNASTSNSAVQCIYVSLLWSTTIEEDETFTVTVTTLSSIVALENDVTTVTIKDQVDLSE